MAANFLSGYVPEDEATGPGPLYPGYFAGKPLSKIPKSKNYLAPIEFDYDYINTYVNNFDADVTGLPRYFKDRIIDDFKDNLKAAYRPPDVTLDTLDDFDPEVLPGVFGMNLSLNPEDWSDPKKQFTKTIKAWTKSATGISFDKNSWNVTGWESSDYENRVKTVLWANVMGLKDTAYQPEYNDSNGANGGNGGNANTPPDTLGARIKWEYDKRAKHAFARSVEAISSRTAFGNEGIQGEDSPFFIAKSGVVDSFTGADLYTTVAQNVVKFETNLRNGIGRQKNYDAFVLNSAVAVGSELTGEFLTTNTDRNNDDVKRSGIGYVVTGWKNNAIPEAYAPAIETFAAKAENAKQMSLFITYQVNGAETLIGTLEKKLAGVRGDITSAESKTDYLSPMATLDGKNKLDTFRGKVKGERERIINYSSGNWISDSVPTDLKDKMVADLGRQTKEYIAVLDNMQKILDDADKMDSRQLYSRLKSVTSGKIGISGRNINAIHSGFVRELEEGLFLAPHGSRSQSGKNIHNLSEFLSDPNIRGYTKADGKTLYAKRVLPIGRRMMAENTTNYAYDIYEAAAGGKLIERYVWSKAAVLLTGYTPAELARNQLTKVHYFGLVIDDNFVTKRQAADKAFNAAHRYKFNVNFDVKDAAGNVTKYGAKVAGGLHMSAVDFVDPFTKLPKSLSEGQIINMILGREDLTKFKGVLPDLTMTALVTGPNNALTLTGVGQMREKQLAEFRKWLANNEFKIDFTRPENEDKLKALLKALAKENRNPDTLKITTQYVGHIQKIAVKLNKLQTKLFGKFAPFLKPIFQIKSNIAEKLSQLGAEALSALVAKLASGALAGATAGLGALLDPLIQKFIKPLIAFFVRKTLDFGQAFVGGILKGDIWQAFSALEKEVNSLVKVGLYIGAIPVVIIFIISFGFLNLNIGSNSPIDPTKGNQGYSGYYTSGGAEQLVRVEKHVTVSCVDATKCSPMTDPTVSVPNEALVAGIKVVYTITITPQITFTDFTGISFDDETVIRYGTATDRHSETIFEKTWGTGDITSFNPQQPITITIPDSGDMILHHYPDSRVSNTFSVHLPAVLGHTQGPSQAIATRSFRIGSPTIGEACFDYEGPWPSGVRANFESAAEELGVRSGNYYADLCAAGRITLHYIDNGANGCIAEATGASDIEFRIGSACGLQNNINWVMFWIAHETMHVYSSRLGIQGAFNGAVAGELGMPTYPFHDARSTGGSCWYAPGCQTSSICDFEDLAESFGNYFYLDAYGGSCYTGTTDHAAFWAQYPKHKQFIEDNIL